MSFKRFIGCLLLASLFAPSALAQQLTGIARHFRFGPTLPTNCRPSTGDIAFRTAVDIGPYYCSSTDTWTKFAASGSGPTGSGTANHFTLWTSSSAIGSSNLVNGTNVIEFVSGTTPQTFRIFGTNANTGEALQLVGRNTTSNRARVVSKQLASGATARGLEFGYEQSDGTFLGFEIDTSGNLQTGSGTTNLHIGSSNAPQDVTVGSTNGTGSFKIKGSTSGTLTLTVPDATTNHTLTFSGTQGAANSVPVNNGSGALTWTTPITVPIGGTGLASTTAYALVAGGTTSTAALQQVSGVGTSGQVLVSAGAGALPTWTAPVTVPSGGTGLASTTAYAVLAGGTTSTAALQSVSGVGTSGQVLTSNGAGALPTWQAAAGGGISGTTGTIDLFPGGFATDGTGSGNNAATLQLDVSTGTQTSNTPKASENVLLLDSATDEHWEFVRSLPSDYASGGTLRGWVKSSATSGNFVMKGGIGCAIDGTTNSNTILYNAADLSSATAVNGTAGVTVQFTITLTTTNMAALRKCHIFIGRDADNGSDTVNAADIALECLVLEYTR